MYRAGCVLFLTIIIVFPLSSVAQDVCTIVDGAVIIAQDAEHTYLGKITSKYDSDSIFNEYGTYGSQYSSKSIWNEYATFGGKYSSYSPFNEYSSEPPMIIKDRSLLGYLSTNKYIQGSVSPNLIKALCAE